MVANSAALACLTLTSRSLGNMQRGTSMQITVGELAKRCGLTIRTLHHYDSIGLLKPSLRSAAGYRLYDRANVDRLLFRAYAGDDPATHARIREAYAKEPDLRSGSAVDDALLGYVRESIASMQASHRHSEGEGTGGAQRHALPVPSPPTPLPKGEGLDQEQLGAWRPRHPPE
jgi:DNA-binding transcriptional MerR regulator